MFFDPREAVTRRESIEDQSPCRGDERSMSGAKVRRVAQITFWILAETVPNQIG
jgi:hypothetical protein